MMTASARRVDSPHATTPREAEALQKMAAVAGAAARENGDESAAAGDENKPANGVPSTSKSTKKQTSSKADAGKQQQSESDDAEDDDGDDDDDEDDDKRKSPSKEDGDTKSATDKDDDDDEKKSSKKSRRELPPHTVAILKGWMLSPEHVKHPYPTDEDKQMLLKKTGINMKQLTNWFTNARKRIWKPMMRREHSRQLQSAMEYEKARPRDGFPGGPVPAMPPYREGPPYPPRAAIRHSFDAGSLGGPPPYHPHPYDMAPPPPPHPGYGVPPHAAYPPRVARSVSESGHGDVDEYMDAMRIRKRAHEVSPDGVDGGDGLGDKRYRRSAMMSPRCLKILQDWVAAHSHMEYPVPGDSDKLQLSRDTGLDVQQIELWFKTSVGRYGVPLQTPPPHPAPQQQGPPPVPHGHPAYRSIPTRDNPMYPPPPAYGERRSIPGQGNPMFPPRPAPGARSSIPGGGNPQFPPPPAVRRESSEGYRAGMAPPGYAGYPPPPHQGYEGEAARPMRTLSINSAQYGHPAVPGGPMAPMPTPVGAPNGAASGLPSLTGRPVPPGARASPTVGQARDSRSHTLDMGQFESRRRTMNFQDILASTSSQPHGMVAPAPVAPRPMMGANGYDASRPPNAENVYPTEVAAPYAQKMYDQARNPAVPGSLPGEPQAPR